MHTPTKSQPAKQSVFAIVTDHIMAYLKRGIIPWHISWANAGIPTNLLTSKPYRGINVILLAAHKYDRNLFLSFNQLKGLGATVKKGELAHIVVYWKNTETGEQEPGKHSKLQYYPVFNIAQCDGIPERKLPVNACIKRDPVEAFEHILWNMRRCPEILHSDGLISYDPISDQVILPTKQDFFTEVDYYVH